MTGREVAGERATGEEGMEEEVTGEEMTGEEMTGEVVMEVEIQIGCICSLPHSHLYTGIKSLEYLNLGQVAMIKTQPI